MHAGSSGQDARPSPFTLGVVRSDGILLPFAAFDGDEDWSTPWPGAFSSARAPGDLPVNLAAVPEKWWGEQVPPEWRLWPRGSKAPLLIKLIAPIVTPVGVQRRVGVRTDFLTNFNPFVPPYELPYPKEGLAVGGTATVLPITQVSHLAPAAVTLIERLRGAIERAEERTVRSLRSNTGWTHPFNGDARRKIVPTMEAWYANTLPDSGVNVSYVEIVKKYPPQPEDEGCGLESFITGWVHDDPRDKQPKATLGALITYCDREKASYMLPFGQMHLGERVYWVYQMSGHDHEWYVVTEVERDRSRVVAEYHGGGLLQ
jgi:hypothetical protein